MAQLSQSVVTLDAGEVAQADVADPSPQPKPDPRLDGGGSSEVNIPVFRHDLCGPFAVELLVPAAHGAAVLHALLDRHNAIPVGDDVVQVRRIEAGIPWPGREITSEYLPAETRQQERAVSFQKGCYLGQEVVERMRSRHVVARQLVGLRLETAAEQGASILDADGKPVGQLTSAGRSPFLNAPIALGYVKTALSSSGTRLIVGEVPALVVDLPFRR
jgi:aminomethyltransferase